jgi:uncharacterized protein (UPF0261 family)
VDGPFYDPKGYQLLLNSLKKTLKPGIRYSELDLHINDAAFADLCVATFLELLDIKESGSE